MDSIKSFIGKSALYSALIAIILVTLYRYTKIDVVMPVIKVLTFGGYTLTKFKGI